MGVLEKLYDARMIARCGFECHVCMAFIANHRTPSGQTRVAHGWSKYFGVVVRPEKIRLLIFSKKTMRKLLTRARKESGD
jgi:hypothetical protein